LDFGIRVIIAPTFADIFYNNCFKNGMLPITLPSATIASLLSKGDGIPVELTIDLPNQKITRLSDGFSVGFSIDADRKSTLVLGLDEIGVTLQRDADIEAFEIQRSAAWPWLDGVGGRVAALSSRGSDAVGASKKALNW
jgi:3-isopropylmalate dehydratase small subunit